MTALDVPAPDLTVEEERFVSRPAVDIAADVREAEVERAARATDADTEAQKGHFERQPCPLGWWDARCGRFGPCGCEPANSPDAMRSSPEDSEQALEVARWLLSEAQPHVGWDTSGPEVQQHFIDRAVSMFAACPSLAVWR